MRQDQAKDRVARTAHLTAWIRALGRYPAQVPANADFLAERFLFPHQRWLNRLPNLTRKVLERSAPGAFGYFNARTCYFDDVLLREATAGLDQLVLLHLSSPSFRKTNKASGLLAAGPAAWWGCSHGAPVAPDVIHQK